MLFLQLCFLHVFYAVYVYLFMLLCFVLFFCLYEFLLHCYIYMTFWLLEVYENCNNHEDSRFS